MEITCSNCSAHFKVPDNKVPKGQVLSLPCPKCKHKMSIDTRSAPPGDDAGSAAAATPPKKKAAGSNAAAGASKKKTAGKEDGAAPAAGKKRVEEEKPVSKTLMDQVATGYDAGDKPFDFVEEGVQTALLCETDSALRSRLKAVLVDMGYTVTEPKAPMEALKQMRFHNYNLIVLNERFGTSNPDENHVCKYLDRLDMEFRRHIFVVLLSGRFRTNDHMMAFNKSVNLILHMKNMEEFKKILSTALSEYELFYKVYSESMVKAGRA